MNDDEIAKLEDEDEWDFATAQPQRAPRGNRAVVSVGFRTDDFTLVAEAARSKDQPISQFIREAAVSKARSQHNEPYRGLPPNVITIKTTKLDESLLLAVLQRRQSGPAAS
jgi:hypothetical protein